MIKAVLFDYGGVVTDGGAGMELSELLAANLGVTPQQAQVLLGAAWGEFIRGTITEAEAWQKIEAAYGSPISADKRQVWNTWDVMQPRPEIVKLIKQVKAQGIRVGLLSNVMPPTAADIKAHGGYDVFDFLVLSCETGYAKPEPKIYELALAQLQAIKPTEVVFIDDMETGLVPARELGIQTILATSAEQIITDVTKLLEAS